MNFAVIDIIFMVLILIFILRCALKGFISEVMSMAALALGLLASLYFFRKGGEIIRDRFMPGYEIISRILAFIALFVIVFVLIKILEHILKGIVHGIMLGPVDHVLGIVFGCVEGLVVVSLALFVLNIQPLFDPRPLLEQSFFARLLLPLISGGKPEAAANTVYYAPFWRNAGSV